MSVERYSDGRLQVSEPTESDKSEMATIISEKRQNTPPLHLSHSLTHSQPPLSQRTPQLLLKTKNMLRVHHRIMPPLHMMKARIRPRKVHPLTEMLPQPLLLVLRDAPRIP